MSVWLSPASSAFVGHTRLAFSSGLAAEVRFTQNAVRVSAARCPPTFFTTAVTVRTVVSDPCTGAQGELPRAARRDREARIVP